MPQSINRYLHDAKTNMTTSTIDLVVMGNEAADLDSMASSIVFAYIRSSAEPDKHIIPFMPIPRSDFKLRPEAVYVFEKAMIDPDSLIFTDDLPWDFMDRVKRLGLVDHNKLSYAFQGSENKVKIILDHHKEQGLYPGTATRVIEPVGSTATLVGKILVREFSGLINAQLATLLTATILLDTVNLNPDGGRVTDKDSDIAASLLPHCSFDRETCFRELSKAKFDTAGLTTTDLLRKDYKEFEFGGIRCGIASVPLSMAQWTKKENELSMAFERYARQRHLDVFLSMNAYTDPDFKRDLAVYCIDTVIHDKLIACLQQRGLNLTTIIFNDRPPSPAGKITFYSQANSKISRKKLVPMLDEHFTG